MTTTDEVPVRIGTLMVRGTASLFLLVWTLASIASINNDHVAGGWELWLPSAWLGAVLLIYSIRTLQNPVIKFCDDYLHYAFWGTYRRIPLASIHRGSRWSSKILGAHLLSLSNVDGRVLHQINLVGFEQNDIDLLHSVFERHGIPVLMEGSLQTSENSGPFDRDES